MHACMRVWILLLSAFLYGGIFVTVFIDEPWFWIFFGEWRNYVINLVHFAPFFPLLFKKKFRLFLSCYFLSTLGNDLLFGAFKPWWNYDLFYFWSVAFNPFGTWARWHMDDPIFGRSAMTGQKMFVNLMQRFGWLIFLAAYPKLMDVLTKRKNRSI